MSETFGCARSLKGWKMMRATNLLSPLLSERHSPRRRRKRAASTSAAAQPAAPAPATMHEPVERIRRAGGPMDNACYTCECGLVFAAPVTTTVACPRCGTDQAW